MPPFLKAEWRDLIVVNYQVDPAILAPYVPYGTELDIWEGAAIVSLVAFHFCDTRVFGVPVPFYRTFEEVNLRFYVLRRTGEGVKRGVVFIKEFVPKRLVASVANLVYGEHYASIPMSHHITAAAQTRSVSYSWQVGETLNHISAEVSGRPQPLPAGSEAEFILDHFWGYTKLNERKTSEYQVTHPQWLYWEGTGVSVEVEFASSYGVHWSKALGNSRRSAFIADGSAVAVFPGTVIR